MHFHFQAGIKTNKIMIALEPEAAFTFCKEFSDFEQRAGGMDVFSPRQRYLILNARGKVKSREDYKINIK